MKTKLYAVVLKQHKYHGEMIVFKANLNCLAVSEVYLEAIKMKKDIIKYHGHTNFYIQKFIAVPDRGRNIKCKEQK